MADSVLAERLGVPPHPPTDLTGLDDARAADVLNAPDLSLPEIVTMERTLIGPAAIMKALGPQPAATFLNALDAASSSQPVLTWLLHVLKAKDLDVADPMIRQHLAGLATEGLLTTAQSATLLALAERRRRPSWVEHHGIAVTARTVGIARGSR